MKNNRQQLFIFHEELELYNSLKRAFEYLDGIELKNFDALSQEDHDSVVLICADNRNDLFKRLWGVLRIDKKRKNPVAAIGTYCLDSSEDVRDKVFERLWKSHVYFQMPFDLKKLLASLKKLTPLKKLKQTIKEYSDIQGLIIIAFHDLRGLLGGGEELSPDGRKGRICNMLLQIKELLAIMEEKKETLGRIENIVLQVQQSSMSEDERNNFISLVHAVEKEVFK